MRVNIEAERGRMQLTKGQFAKRLGITTRTYNSYIAGNPIPSDVLVLLRVMTGKTVDYLLGLEGAEK